MSERTELIEQANELGLEFPGNISTAKLKGMVAESQGPAVKADPEPVEAAKEPKGKEVSPVVKARARAAAKKRKATRLRVVTITNKDQRENSVMTTVHLSVENQFFSVGRIVPLDVPVELEECLIKQAKSTTMTLHKDEIVDGRRTGNKRPVTVKKFAISYEDPELNKE